MPISALPTPPSRSDSPQDFSDRADALLGALPSFVTEANALQSDVNAKESSVSSYATIATNKASEAQASANTASTKASEAAASAIAAAAAASNAEIAFDSFDDKYLGSKSSDPATDNDGNSLLIGALYWNTTVGAVRVWNGSVWLSMAADASIVDFQQAGAGAVVRTAQDKMRDQLSVKDFGAVGDGVNDDSLAFIAARTAAAGAKIYVPAGHYKINQSITSAEDLFLDGDGPSTILDFTGTVSGGGYGLEAIGVETQIQDLSSNATAGARTITFASAPSLSVGDVFFIYNPTDFSWSPWRASYRAGEWCEVEAIVGNVVTLRNPLYGSYSFSSVDVYKVAGPKVRLSNFAILGTTVTGLVKLSLCVEPLLENITGRHQNNSVFYIDRCYKPVINNPQVHNVGDGGDDYGIVVGNSQHARIIGGSVYSRRHAVAVGGADAVGAISVRDLKVIGVTLKNDVDSGVQAADMHGNMEDCEYLGCTIYGGGLLAGRNNRYVDCKIYGDINGNCIYTGELLGGRVGASGCEMVTYTDPHSGNRGIFDVGSQNDALSSSLLHATTVYAENCKLYGRNLSANTPFMRFRLAGATVRTNFIIDGLTADVDSFGPVLRSSVTSGTPSCDAIVIDRLAGLPSGTLLHSATGGAYTNFPHRCQRQTGSQSLTATSGTSVTIGDAASFKYVYPRAPSAQAGGETSIAGNVAALPCLGTVTTSSIVPKLISATAVNWASSITRTVYWSACIDEV